MSADYDKGRWGGVQHQRVDPIWEQFCATVVDRIEAIRLEECNEPRCPTCGATAFRAERKCQLCHQLKPLTEFPRNRQKAGGRQYRCSACSAAYLRDYRRKQKRETFRRILGVAS